MIRRMKIASALSIVRISVILPLVGVILGALIGLWVEEGIVFPIIGAVWGGGIGLRAAFADMHLEESRYAIFSLYGREGAPKSWGLVVQALGAGLIGWLTDIYAFEYMPFCWGWAVFSSRCLILLRGYR